jgi:predicted permease
MSAIRDFMARLAALGRGRRLDDRIDEEIASHIELATADHIARGMSASDARLEALRQFGGVLRTRETHREVRGFAVFDALRQDVRYALRSYSRSPVFTAVALGTLALAIGANTAIFSLLNALVLRELPVRDPESLVLVHTVSPVNSEGAFSLPAFRALAGEQRSFSALIGWLSNSVVTVEIDGRRTRGAVSTVTGNYFSELGVRPAAGRLLVDDDLDLRAITSAPVVVLGYSFWQREFRGDPSVVGRTIRVESTPLTVIGVAPRGFMGFGLIMEPDVTVPIILQPRMMDVPVADFALGRINAVRIVGRLRPGATIDQARAELAAIWPATRTATVPPEWSGPQRERFLATRVEAKSAATGVETRLRERYARPLAIVMGIAGLILLIACVNLASLLLSRAAARTQEIGIRLALGAGRARIARQVLVEGLLLSLGGAALGVLFAAWTSAAIVRVMFSDYLVPAGLDVTPDARMLSFTAAVAVVVAALFSAAPAWRLTSGSAADALQQRNSRAATASSRTGRWLVAAQIALSLVLVANAGLLVRTLQQIRSVPAGMLADNVSVTYPGPLPGGYKGGAIANDSYYPLVVDRLRAVRGVHAASIATFKPAGGGAAQATPVTPIDDADVLGHGVPTIESGIAAGFFDTLGIPLLAGRDFSWRDTSTSRHVAIVSNSLARQLFANATAVGQRIRVGVRPQDQDVEIVGVVADAHLLDLRSSNLLVTYMPALQSPSPDYKCFVIRGRGVSPEEINRAVEALGRERVGNTESLNFITDRVLLQERMSAALAAFFGVLALLLSAIGLYGLMSYAVTQRRREIGIRVALGARPDRVMRDLIRDGLSVTCAGVGVGLIAALAAVQLVKSLLFGITPYDPVTLVAAPVSLLVVAIVASALPAARAARVDPMEALRAE